jgi:uncharacterized membrane protein
MRIASKGHVLFAITLIVLGLMGLSRGDFAPIWDSVPKGLPGRGALAYLSALICLACGAGVLLRRAAAGASRVLVLYLLLWLVLIKGRFILLQPLVEASYQSSGETAVILAGAWVLYAWFAMDWDRAHLGFAVGEKGVRIARVLYGLALLAFGFSHFAYLDLTAPLVPNWLPAHVFWAYLTGATYIAAGVAVLVGFWARLAATLSTLQIAGFTSLVWVPFLIAGNISAEHWVEFVVSWTLTTAAWVVTDSYRGMPWLATNRR